MILALDCRLSTASSLRETIQTVSRVAFLQLDIERTAMKRTERSGLNAIDGGTHAATDHNEQGSSEHNDAEIAEIVDVIGNDSTLLHSEMTGVYDPLPPLPLMIMEDRKVKVAKRPKLDPVYPKINYNLICDRLVGTLHMPLQTPKMGKDKKDTRSTCGICAAKTTIKCSHCGVGLCIADRDGRNCWREFHTRQVLEYKQQPKADRKERSRVSSSSFSDSTVAPNNLQQELDHMNSTSSSSNGGDSSEMV